MLQTPENKAARYNVSDWERGTLNGIDVLIGILQAPGGRQVLVANVEGVDGIMLTNVVDVSPGASITLWDGTLITV